MKYINENNKESVRFTHVTCIFQQSFTFEDFFFEIKVPYFINKFFTTIIIK